MAYATSLRATPPSGWTQYVTHGRATHTRDMSVTHTPIVIIAAGQECRAIGNVAILQTPKLALFCSIKCPGELILKLFDLAKELRDKRVGVISGFHAPMNKECFDILLRGTGPIVWCPARSIEGMRLKPAYKKAIDDGRLLIVSSFPARQRRMSKERAEVRNRLVASLADRVFVAYADPGGKTEQLCREVIASSKPLFTFDSRHNQNLLTLGAKTTTEVAIATPR
jgi:predicted Rossmann fold nucleotide-binding protein DprA/Smf involved in DNA uptake